MSQRCDVGAVGGISGEGQEVERKERQTMRQRCSRGGGGERKDGLAYSASLIIP